MKRYFKWDDDDNDIRTTTYIEIDDGIAYKQIAASENKYVASNRKDEKHHFYLSEGIIDVNDILEYGGSEISERQFYSIWNKYKNGLIESWNRTKGKFPIGSDIEGIIEAFYPQGVIINISQDIIGIADYNKCKNNSITENLYPRHKVIGKVDGYDEENMWLIIVNPKVL